ncbi:MAG: type II toxin-antitoxin system PemK/MazF family toxin [Candidatus Geothermincolia bacterium]
MKRGEFYRVANPSTKDPKRSRVFVIVSRQTLIDSRFSTVICAPVFSVHDGLSTQIPVGVNEGLKHDSSIHCDELVSIPKAALTNYVGILSQDVLQELNISLRVALEMPDIY